MRCKCCNILLDSGDLRYRQKESKEHDGLCSSCRNLSFDTHVFHEYTLGVVTESVQATLAREGRLTIEEIPSNYTEDY